MIKLFKTQQDIIREIHNEFDTAQDRLLSQAERILSELSIPTESSIESRAARLASVGFVNTPDVKKAEKLKESRKKVQAEFVKSKEEAELIRHYKQTYPFLKFLTESELDRICGKYGLMYAPVSNYIKEVPEKNLREIESAQPLAYKDKGENQHFLWIWPRWVNVRPDRYDRETLLNDREGKTINKQGLFIAAPASHFKRQGLLKQGNGLFNATIDDDPIVFRYCKGGVQVLSKWGLEANEPALTNENHN